MKLLYKPFALIAGVVGAKAGQSAFKAIWSKLDESEPPDATTEDASLAKVVGAKALEAATVAGVAAAVNRASARSFHYLFGIWPGEKDQKPAEG
jgi:predicted DNA-binding transcriptional regulator YafY